MNSELDNSPDRLIRVFFYGLYLDPDVLRGKGVEPRTARPGLVTGRSLMIGRQATLLRSIGGQACGVVYSITHDEFDRLYAAAGLTSYRAESVLVRTLDGDFIPALCCTLLQAPGEREGNADYARDLSEAMVRAGLPGPFPELSVTSFGACLARRRAAPASSVLYRRVTPRALGTIRTGHLGEESSGGIGDGGVGTSCRAPCHGSGLRCRTLT